MKVKNKPKMHVASKMELTHPVYSQRLWLTARNMEISSRIWPEFICDAVYHFDGVFIMPDGRIWPVPDVDSVMGDPRWIRSWFEEQDGKPRRQTYMLERLRLIDLYFRIQHPDIARHFGR